jgi:O-antigen/teichoic acid export membrane protein
LGVAWTYAGVLVQTAIGLLLLGYAVRALGPSAYAPFAVLLAVQGLLYVVDFGLGMGVVASASRAFATSDEGERARALRPVEIAHQVYLRIGSGIGALALLASPVVWWAEGPAIAVTAALVVASAGLNLALACPLGAATGARRFDVIAASTVAGSVTTLLVVLSFLHDGGLVVLGIGQLASVLVARLVLVLALRDSPAAFPLAWRPVERQDVRRVVAGASPLVFANVGNQVINTVNLVTIGFVANASAVGIFRAASSVPTQAVGLLFRGYDVAFPNIVTAGEPAAQERLNADLMRLVSVVGGIGLGWIVAERGPLSTDLLGHASTTAAYVLAIFALVWIVNIPAHGLSLLLIGRDAQRVFVPLTVFEGVFNIALTVVLGARWGATGAASACLVSIAISNFVLLPILSFRHAAWTARRGVVVAGYLPAALGLGTALAVCALIPGSWGAYLAGLALLLVAVPVVAVVVGPRIRLLLREAIAR